MIKRITTDRVWDHVVKVHEKAGSYKDRHMTHPTLELLVETEALLHAIGTQMETDNQRIASLEARVERAYTANALAVRKVLAQMALDGEIDALTAGEAEVAIIERFGKILRGEESEETTQPTASTAPPADR